LCRDPLMVSPVKPPVLQVTDFYYAYSGASANALDGISFRVTPGECVGITGPSGCGKTTLLLATCGLLKGGKSSGTFRFAKGMTEPAVGMVFQNADSQILSTTVEDEVAFGPTNLNFPAPDIRQRVKVSLSEVGLSGYETRNVETLSAGEKHRLTLASVLSMNPSILLLDEPAAQLDAPGKSSLLMIMKRLKQQGYTLIVADHDMSLYQTVVDRFVLMKDGRIQNVSEELFEVQEPLAKVPAIHPRNITGSLNSSAIHLHQVSISQPNGPFILDQATVEIHRGELVHLFGENGTGKSTLLKTIAGLIRPEAGGVNVIGIASPKPEQLRWKVGLLLQNPSRQLFEDTVFQEVSFSLKRQGLSSQEIHARVSEALAVCMVEHLSDRSPFTLSYGEQHRVTLASILVLQPEVLLLDEPFSGLDFAQRYRLLRVLENHRERHLCTVMIASHDPLPDPGWPDRTLSLEAGRLVEI
jgi:energy-coupling factor transporter ATP-binding protein EcfA2